ncbi:rCG39178 [Rattus norvegicus]|uniref:RCG39178 n=1 Tax=Rattus norvegicus TaxID=10116 RepID=A6KMH6_RAT|nr:rCG39178 [Rattus norvegicus]
MQMTNGLFANQKWAVKEVPSRIPSKKTHYLVFVSLRDSFLDFPYFDNLESFGQS